MKLIITGIRGVPASHGGFETFAENLAVYLVNNGWEVTVYCQESANEVSEVYESNWNGVCRIHIPVKGDGAKATVAFDYLTVKHALKKPGLVLTLGYNTACFNLLFRLKRKKNVINMDGIEWKRDKWAWHERAWLYLNERAGCLIGHHLIADHPEIKNHLSTRVNVDKITIIPYGARRVDNADMTLLAGYSLQVGGYALIIARPEPENSILEIVTAFSKKKRGKKLVVLGKYDLNNAYHSQVINQASDEVVFVGAIYNHADLDALRFYSCLYIHGHTVGGTNPSLVEALGSGQSVLAHDNKFNRWVVGDAGIYFSNISDIDKALNVILFDDDELNRMSKQSIARYNAVFTWDIVLEMYKKLLEKFI